MKFIASIILLLAFSVIGFGQQNVGTTAQNFTETTINGENIELEQLKGKIVVMTFWSTRCQICSVEIPKLNKLVKKYDGREVVFLGLAWQDKVKLEKYMRKKPFDFKIIPQSFGVLLKYADRDSKGRLNMGFPSHFVVDQNGQVVYKASGFKKAEKIDSLLGKLLSE